VEESKNRQIEFSGILLFGVMIQVKSKYIVIIIKMSTKKVSKKDCKHTKIEEIKMPDDYMHYGKSVCGDCGKFINWIPNPNVTAKFKQRQKDCDVLLSLKVISEYEREFLDNIQTIRILSLKQQTFYDSIVEKYM
jgi:hypothetical protein